MRKSLLMSLLLLLSTSTVFAIVSDDKKITIRNHTGTTMNYFLLGSDNMEYFSDLIKKDNYFDNPFLNKHSSSSFVLHASEYPASFLIAIIESADLSYDEIDEPQNTSPVCIVGAARSAPNEKAFGRDIINYSTNDKFNCKIYYGNTVSIWNKRKSPFGFLSKN